MQNFILVKIFDKEMYEKLLKLRLEKDSEFDLETSRMEEEDDGSFMVGMWLYYCIGYDWISSFIVFIG